MHKYVISFILCSNLIGICDIQLLSAQIFPYMINDTLSKVVNHKDACDCSNFQANIEFIKRINLLDSVACGTFQGEYDVSLLELYLISIETITHIRSSIDANYIGRYCPSKNDIEKWRKWLLINSNILCWDTINNAFFLIKKHNPTLYLYK